MSTSWNGQQQPPRAPVPVAGVRTDLPVPGRTGHAATVVRVVIIVAAAWLLLFLALHLPTSIAAVSAIVSLVPLALCLLGLRWVDRWDPEPSNLVWTALLWGAAPAVGLALLWESVASPLAMSMDNSGWLELSVAPVAEEVTKGIGVLILVWVARKYFHGPVDGVVYGGLIGAGFAFTENILYFASAVSESPASLVATFVGRGLFSPFAHVLFTAWTGAAVGWALERGSSRGGIFGAWLLGLIPAIGAHFLWNALASGALGVDFLPGYAPTQVPFFLAAILTCVLLVRREQRLTASSLRAYAAAGWYSPDELAFLCTPRGRREAMRWAGARGGRPQMRRVMRNADALSVIHQRIVRSPHDPELVAQQRELLSQSMTAREGVRAAAAPGPGGWTAA